MPRVDDPNHAKLESDINQYLLSKGAICFAIPYHDVVELKAREALRLNDSITSHLVRTRSDQHAIFPDGNVIKWDAKYSSTWKTGNDFSIEALPLLVACAEAIFFGCDYYFFLRRSDGSEYSLRAGRSTLDRIQRVLIPAERHSLDSNVWKEMYDKYFTLLGYDKVVQLTYGSRGSGDPFACLWVDDGTLMTWKSTIDMLSIKIIQNSS